ncbi:MAG: TIGR03032 family protein [Acidobacteriota bacterium]
MTTPTAGPPQPAKGPGIEVTASRHFVDWLQAAQASLVVSTYHSNRLFLFGLKEPGRLSVFQRVFERAMGVAARAERIYLSTRFQLWQLENVFRTGETEGPYDRLYRPQRAWTTGDIDIHDIGFGADDEPIFISSLFSCIATVDERHSFRPIWRPPYISKLAPEDRCHLNGMAMDGDTPGYVTAVATSDVAAGWRSQRQSGGVVIDVESNEIVGRGLSMPHSPRLHDGKLWVLHSGTGELGQIDLDTGRFEPICFCPGYLRGLTFHRGFAIVGMSQCREDRTFSGLELDDRLRDKGAEARCGIAVIDLATGSLAHWLELSGGVRELYDVQVLPGFRCPKAIGLRNKEIWGVVSYEDEGETHRHTGVPRD